MKLFITAFVLILLASVVIFYSDRPTTPITPPPITNPIKVFNVQAFKPEEVDKLNWKFKNESQDFEKKQGVWKTLSKTLIDQWGLNRRLVVLSNLHTIPLPPITDPLGDFTLKTSTQELHGQFSEKIFQWSDGPSAGQSVNLNDNSALRDLLAEGLWGFKSHNIKICDVKKLTKVSTPNGEIKKSQNGQWLVYEKEDKTKVKSDALSSFLEKICQIEVSSFDLFTTLPTMTPSFELEMGSKIIESKKGGNLYAIKGFPPFRSEDLDHLLTTSTLENLKDPTLNEANVAKDRKSSQEDRIKAIRVLRGNSSPEALASLKAIIFEKTDIDLYRYEAVDTLAATGTKEAYKIILERLAEIGRSGFELRLARALSSGMGRFFKSDEKTPEEIRRPEVDELIKAARANPPGK